MRGRERDNYNSGDDFLLEYGELTFTYSATDFGQRAESAARTLEIIDGHLEEGEIEDLICLVTGELPIEEPVSPLGEHLNDSKDLIKPDAQSDQTLVHWLRRLIFRGSWFDQRVKEGELRPRFNPNNGDFDYLQPEADAETGEPIALEPPPSWRYIAYDPGR